MLSELPFFPEISYYSNYVLPIYLNKALLFEDYEYKHWFKKVGDIKLTNEDTRVLWDVELQIPYSEYILRGDLIYLIICDNRIIKIGGSKTGLKDRITSYHCGHCIRERKKTNGEYYPGKASVTNMNVYNTIFSLLLEGKNIELHYYKLEPIKIQIKLFGKNDYIIPEIYTSFEKHAMDKYKAQNGCFPPLCKNNSK